MIEKLDRLTDRPQGIEMANQLFTGLRDFVEPATRPPPGPRSRSSS